MISQMGVMLAGLKIADMKQSQMIHHDSEMAESEQPGWLLKQAGRWLQVVGAKMAFLGERIGHESNSAPTTALTAQE